MQLPGGLSAEEFLRDYWQKKPLVIRQAFAGLRSPVSADEMAGLACEPAVESRLVVEQENGKPWQLHNGPFEPETFAALPDSPWSLLIQGLDHWVPEAADILEAFRFIPNWRLDDIMASYAPPGGSVGPHFDQYDVFLLQAEGRRRWYFGGHCDEQSARVEGTPLRILADWKESETAVLEPGDMLYLPPGVGHHGVAVDDCITLSVGFRAPTVDDLLTGFSDYLCSLPGADQHLTDPDLQPQDNPGTLTPQALNRARARLLDQLQDEHQFALWFGQFTTAPKSEDIVEPAEEPLNPASLLRALQDHAVLRWNEGSRFVYHDDDEVTALFVDGERYLLRGNARTLAPVLCMSNRPDPVAVLEHARDEALLGLLTTLYNQGNVYLE